MASSLFTTTTSTPSIAVALLGTLLPGGVHSIHQRKQKESAADSAFSDMSTELKKPKAFLSKFKKATQKAAENLAYMTIDKSEPDDMKVVLVDSAETVLCETEIVKVSECQSSERMCCCCCCCRR